MFNISKKVFGLFPMYKIDFLFRYIFFHFIYLECSVMFLQPIQHVRARDHFCIKRILGRNVEIFSLMSLFQNLSRGIK